MVSKVNYDDYATHYDDAEASGAEIRDHSNADIATLLEQHAVRSILDITCGTGSQVLYLAERGFEVVGNDLSEKMLEVAKAKSDVSDLAIEFHQGDMCDVKLGVFDAVISIFNAIGHLSRDQFKLALENIYSQLNPGGIYVFDIFNAGMNDAQRATLAVDATTELDSQSIRKVQTASIDPDTAMMTFHEQKHVLVSGKEAEVTQWDWTMQAYTKSMIEGLLSEAGFQLQHCYGPHLSHFSHQGSVSMLVVAQK